MVGRAPGKLAWKLYLIGFVQLVVLGASVAGVGYLLGPPSRADRPPEPTGSPGDRPGLPGPPGPPGPPPGAHRGGRPSPVAPLLTFLVSGLVIVGVGSFFTARFLVSPLQTLSRTARALGGGDLGARTGLTRNDELGDVGRSFDEMAERIQKLLQAERELLANVSHELRTPLARIRVALDIAGEASPEDGRLSLAEINTDLTEVEGLIDDIMTTARLQIEGAGRGEPPTVSLAPHFEEIAPFVLCTRASERFRARHPRRTLALWADESLPRIRADAVLLRRAIDNLLENADKYSPDADGPVVLRAEAAPSGVVIEVRDQGIGISPEDLPRVFAPFFRSERSRSRGTGGVGLGLTLAKRIVEAHGGTIEVTSTVGVGTTVRVALPAAKA